MRRLAFAIVLASLASCFDEPSYEGRFCDEASPCPSGFRCVAGQCTERAPAPLDGGEEADASIAEDADSGSTDAATPDGAEPDAGDPIVERCSDPVGHPTSGWEARHFTLAGGFTFDRCIGVEDLTSADLDRDFGTNGPLNGTVIDFGSRYTATRTFEAGIHTFAFTHDDGVRLRIDGQLVYEHWLHGYVPAGSAYSTYLSAGAHQLEVEHFDDEGQALLTISWMRGCPSPTAPIGGWALTYHPYDPVTGTIDYDHCYGFDVVSSTALSIVGAPASVAAQGITSNYGVVGVGLHEYQGMTLIDFEFEDGLRADVDGVRVVDEWTAGTPITLSTQAYLPGVAEISFEKFATTAADDLRIDWSTVCELMPATIGASEWWARYYRVLYVASPESWTLDRTDCLGVQTIATTMLDQDGEPPPITALGVTQLWGAEFFGTRTYAQNTTINIAYDDGIRVFSGASLLFEDWFGPQVETTSLTLVGTHSLRLEFFQNFGGVQIHFNW